jgi:hypothetical protein
MSLFVDKETEYLGERRLGRLAGVDVEGRLHGGSVD